MTAVPGAANWYKYDTEDGKAYFHNPVSSLTQWEAPPKDAGASMPDLGGFGDLKLGGGTSDVFQYQPTDTELTGLTAHGPQVDQALQGANQQQQQQASSGGRNIEMQASSSFGAEPAGRQAGGQVPQGDIGAGGAGNSQLMGAMGAAAAGALFSSFSNAANAATDDSGGGIGASLLARAQKMFDVSTDDVAKRLRIAALPYPPQDAGASNDFRMRPDYYGPFWVATTAVLFLAATGNFARLVELGGSTDFKADYSLVSLAATMIYGCLIMVPVLVRAALFCAGAEADTINFHQMICVYGYSLTPAIPVAIISIVPSDLVRWLACLSGLAISLLFVRTNLWTDIAVEAPQLKWSLIGGVTAAQATIFLVYRLHFFHT